MGALHRLGLLGDVHAEDRRLEGALRLFEAERIDTLLCVGDIVDGAGSVDRCCALLRGAGALSVRGNHERWLLEATMRDLPDATPRSSLASSSVELLAALPATLELETARGTLLLCHGMGDDDMHGVKPHDDGYALEVHDALQAVIRASRTAVVVAGHTHERMARTVGGVLLVNPGTLHRGFRSGAAVLDLERGELAFHDIDEHGALGASSRVRV